MNKYYRSSRHKHVHIAKSNDTYCKADWKTSLDRVTWDVVVEDSIRKSLDRYSLVSSKQSRSLDVYFSIEVDPLLSNSSPLLNNGPGQLLELSHKCKSHKNIFLQRYSCIVKKCLNLIERSPIILLLLCSSLWYLGVHVVVFWKGIQTVSHKRVGPSVGTQVFLYRKFGIPMYQLIFNHRIGCLKTWFCGWLGIWVHHIFRIEDHWCSVGLVLQTISGHFRPFSTCCPRILTSNYAKCKRIQMHRDNGSYR